MHRLLLQLVVLIAASLVNSGKVFAFPKCGFEEVHLVAVSPDGRLGLLVSSDSFASDTKVLELQDLATWTPVVAGTAFNTSLLRLTLSDTEADEIVAEAAFDLGPLKMIPVSQWHPLKVAPETVAEVLKNRCKEFPGYLYVNADSIHEYDGAKLTHALVSSGFVAFVYELDDEGCDGVQGDAARAVECNSRATAELNADRKVIENGTAAAVREHIAQRVYHAQHNPVRALLLSGLAASRLTAADVSISLKRISDTMLYLSKLGRLGRRACAEEGLTSLRTTFADALAMPENSESRKSIEYNLKNCTAEGLPPKSSRTK